MSDITSTTAPAAAPAGAGLPWGHWARQIGAILRIELKKTIGRRAIWLWLLAAAPVLILTLRLLLPRPAGDPSDIGEATTIFAGPIYQAFLMRFIIFLGCVAVFGNLIRRELLDRSLHYYFLTPLRRELLVVAKYLSGVISTIALFGASTAACFVLSYLPYAEAPLADFFFQGPGIGHFFAYLGVTALACLGYGAVFLAFGFFFKSPAIPALAVFGWESLLFLLPPLLKKFSVVHYLQSLCPVPVSQGPLALLADAPSRWVAIVGILTLTVALVALSAWKIRRMEVSYDEE